MHSHLKEILSFLVKQVSFIVGTLPVTVRALSSLTTVDVSVASSPVVLKTESSDVTYATPFFWLLPHIKANGFPDAPLPGHGLLGARIPHVKFPGLL